MAKFSLAVSSYTAYIVLLKSFFKISVTTQSLAREPTDVCECVSIYLKCTNNRVRAGTRV